jgi:hypothetical protein
VHTFNRVGLKEVIGPSHLNRCGATIRKAREGGKEGGREGGREGRREE